MPNDWEFRLPTEAQWEYACRALVIHEYLNLATDEDPRLSGRYTGAVLAPRPLEGYLFGICPRPGCRASGLTNAWTPGPASKAFGKKWAWKPLAGMSGWYATSPDFAPSVELDREQLQKYEESLASLNGLSSVLKSAEQRPYASPLGELPMHIARASTGTSEVAWETEPVPDNASSSNRFTFKFLAGAGYISEPAGEFTLFLGDKPLVRFGVTREPKSWTGDTGAILDL